MEIYSTSIQDNRPMDKKYTFDGVNIQPHLKWSTIPKNTKSFALSCIDPDCPGRDWNHWLVYDIPLNVTELQENERAPGKHLPNDFGNPKYEGPSPPKGTGQHRYIFTVYALPTPRLTGVTKSNFVNLVNSQALAKVTLVGLYSRD